MLRDMSPAPSSDFTGDSFVLHVTSRVESQLTKNKDASPKLAIISSLRNGKDATLMYKAFSNSRDFYSRSERKYKFSLLNELSPHHAPEWIQVQLVRNLVLNVHGTSFCHCTNFLLKGLFCRLFCFSLILVFFAFSLKKSVPDQ